MRTFLSELLAAVLLAGAAMALPAAPATASSSPAPAPSSGVNDWRCRPSAESPEPVVLLHGLGAPSAAHWLYMAPYLADRGHCVFYRTYGQVSPLIPFGGLRPIADSSGEVAGFIDRVLESTGADEVDVVGHSEGGFLSLYVPKVEGYGDRIDTVVSLAPPTHGTSFAGLVGLADVLGIRPAVDAVLRTFGCDACTDLITDGAAVRALNDGPVTVPGVDYSIIATRHDAVVTPVETSFVQEPGVENLYVQDVCPHDPVGHGGMAFDPGVASMVANRLDPAGARPVDCAIGPPV